MFRFQLVLLAWACAGPLFAQELDVPHYDHRQTPHLFFPADTTRSSLSGENQAYEYLLTHASVFGLPKDLGNLQFVRKQESLLAAHYYFQQYLNGIQVEGGELVVSINHDQKRVTRVYNNSFPAKNELPLSAKNILSEDDSMDVSWNELRVQGELINRPSAQLVYRPEGPRFHLVWVTHIAVEVPFGYWETTVDAIDGKVLSIREESISRKPVAKRESTIGPVNDRLATLARFEARQRAKDQANTLKRGTANGTGLVFDPDPRTTLNTEALTDTSPASAFTPAYFTRNLLDLDLTAGVYSFNGPYVSIQTFEPPSTPPSTTTTGNWTAVRGNNAFNDATTYFHLDQSQRHMQSLGFTGATGIQEGPIVTDTDGLNGDDNSHYIPGTNRLAFGHGCVDDNEDADVILHEYGHAIHYSINSNWGGGDAGAIGEGFGDYWAGSYSYITPNGAIFHPEWVFTWDGHSNCWPGRDLDRTDLIYDPTRTYGAHSPIPGGGQSDELWSAPVFQSLLDLIALGRSREEVDQIVLEAHFGIGSGVTMRTLANATVAAASELQPGGPHANAFATRFRAQNIMTNTFVTLEADDLVITSEPSGNGAADPDETVEFTVNLHNMGNITASSVSATLSSTDPDVTINTSTSNYPDLIAGAASSNNTAFSITIGPDQICGEALSLTLTLNWTDSSLGAASTPVTLTLPIGEPIPFDQSISPGLVIVDNATVTSTLTVSGTTATVSGQLNIDIDLSHSRIGDLTITLEAPDGTQVVLHNQTGGSGTAIFGNYPGTLTPANSLSSLVGHNLDGDWKLRINDNVSGATGTLSTWAIHDITGYNCAACFGDLNGDGVIGQEDFNASMENWTAPDGDANGDGIGSIIDLIQILAAFGNCE